MMMSTLPLIWKWWILFFLFWTNEVPIIFMLCWQVCDDADDTYACICGLCMDWFQCWIKLFQNLIQTNVRFNWFSSPWNWWTTMKQDRLLEAFFFWCNTQHQNQPNFLFPLRIWFVIVIVIVFCISSPSFTPHSFHHSSILFFFSVYWSCQFDIKYFIVDISKRYSVKST